MDISPEIWQAVGAFTASLVLVFLGLILPSFLLVASLVMLCMKRFREKRRVLLILCGVFAVWIALAWLFL